MMKAESRPSVGAYRAAGADIAAASRIAITAASLESMEQSAAFQRWKLSPPGKHTAAQISYALFGTETPELATIEARCRRTAKKLGYRFRKTRGGRYDYPYVVINSQNIQIDGATEDNLAFVIESLEKQLTPR